MNDLFCLSRTFQIHISRCVRLLQKLLVGKAHLSQLDVLLFVNFSQTQLALFVVQRQPFLILEYLLLRLLLPHNVVPGLTHSHSLMNRGTTAMRSYVYFPGMKGGNARTWSFILCLMISSSCRVISSVTAGALGKKKKKKNKRKVILESGSVYRLMYSFKLTQVTSNDNPAQAKLFANSHTMCS